MEGERPLDDGFVGPGVGVRRLHGDPESFACGQERRGQVDRAAVTHDRVRDDHRLGGRLLQAGIDRAQLLVRQRGCLHPQRG
jgi:hypothetical protein